MDRLWDAIQAREIDAVIIDVLDWLSRDEGDHGAFYHHADRYGVIIELASRDFDESEQGRTMRFIAGLHARMEHVDIRWRTQRGRKVRVAAGKLLAGAYPLCGYVWGDPEKGARTYYVVDPETGHIVVRIFTLVADGMPIRQIARELELEGIPTPGQALLPSVANCPKGAPTAPPGVPAPSAASCGTPRTGASTAPIAIRIALSRCARRDRRHAQGAPSHRARRG
jgi:hypothetical protein